MDYSNTHPLSTSTNSLFRRTDRTGHNFLFFSFLFKFYFAAGTTSRYDRKFVASNEAMQTKRQFFFPFSDDKEQEQEQESLFCLLGGKS